MRMVVDYRSEIGDGSGFRVLRVAARGWPWRTSDDGASRFPNGWTDDPDPAVAEGPHHGAKTVSRWRRDFLRDFADRLDRSP